MKKYHHIVNCFWCNKSFEQRKDTIKRQLEAYGHSCCKNCFGKEQSFKKARSNAMLLNNPFKGKNHTQKTKSILSLSKIGSPSWNKGLNKYNNTSIAKYGAAISKNKTGKFLGANNPNWRGGSSIFNKHSDFFLLWLPFRKYIIQRDFNKCWICNNTYNDNNLEIHHLISKAKHPELKYDELNCILLCKKCHKELHNSIGRINFSFNDSILYINNTRIDEEKLVMH